MESELDRRDLGRLLREKEKALVHILSKHPLAANSKDLNTIREKLEHQPTLPKNRTTRYEVAMHAIETSGNGTDSVLDMQAIVDQTLHDMNIMRNEKNSEIDELKRRLKEKNDLLDDHISRLKTIKHYGNLLVRSSNIYVHKNPGEIAESDKLSSTLSALLDGKPIEKESVKKFARRASLNAVPFDLTSSRAEVVTGSGKSNEEIKTGEHFAGGISSPIKQRESREETKDRVGIGKAVSDPLSELKFLNLSDSGESQCDELFTTVYRLSFAKLEVANDGLCGGEKVVSLDDLPLIEVLDQWISKRVFLSMCLVLDLLDEKLTMQVVVNCFDKAARDSFRGQTKLSNRLYLNDFVVCMTAIANFKYYDESEVRRGVRDEDENVASEARRNRLLRVCLSSTVLQNSAAYIEMSKIFDRVSDVEIFNKLAPRQVFLMTAYKRSRNYVTRSTAESESVFVGPSGKSWPSRTAANGGAANRDRGELSQGSGFYNFCRVYRIFPVLTSDSVVRRISQHVRKMSDDGTAAFLACLVYLSLSLANNMSERGPSTQSELHTRVASILERVICQVEGISLHTAVSKAPTEEGAAKLIDVSTVVRNTKRSPYTRTRDQLILQKKLAHGLLMSVDDDNVS